MNLFLRPSANFLAGKLAVGSTEEYWEELGQMDIFDGILWGEHCAGKGGLCYWGPRRALGCHLPLMLPKAKNVSRRHFLPSSILESPSLQGD